MKQFIALIILITVTVPATAQWKFIDGGLGTTGSRPAFGVHDSMLFESGADNVVDRYISPQNWTQAGGGIDFTQGSVTSFASLGRYFFAGITHSDGGNGPIFSSTNNGAGWSHGTTAGPVGTNGTYLFSTYGGPDQIVLSTDSGNNWDVVFNLTVNTFAARGAYIFASSDAEGVWRSLDSGRHWSKDTTPITTVHSFAFIDSLTFGANGRIIKSNDFGSNWTEVSIPRRNTSLLVSDSTFLFAGTDSGVYVSLDSGTSWREVSEGLPGKTLGTATYNPRVTALIVFDTLLVAGVDVGNGFGYASARPIREMVDTGKSAVRESAVVLDTIEIYPNPSTGMVSIRTGGTSILGVSVLNVLGVDVLDMPNLRESDFTLDLSKLSAGTYFARIITAYGKVQTLKLVVQH